MLREIYVPKTDETDEQFRMLHNEDITDLGKSHTAVGGGEI
jgi:hypothetical protein